MNSKKLLTDEQQFFSEISELLQAGREVAYRAVNLKPIGKLVSALLSGNSMVRRVQIMVNI